MSLEKITYTQNIKPEHNGKIKHLYHVISRVFETLEHDAPLHIQNTTKYDLIARNTNEALLLITYRKQQAEQLEKKMKKLKNYCKRI